MSSSIVYLIPSELSPEGLASIPPVVVEAIKDCSVFFTENERTARRFFKKIWKEIVIDDQEWFTIGTQLDETASIFLQKIKEEKKIGIVSEAGCPGIADPGQELIRIAQQHDVKVKPLAGPSSILLALMASGMNGQHFRFNGYLPINEPERSRVIKELETDSHKKNCTQLFIETPYRNNQLLEALLKNCRASTQICIAVDLTSAEEWVKTKTVEQWKKEKPELHKKQAIFCLQAH